MGILHEEFKRDRFMELSDISTIAFEGLILGLVNLSHNALITVGTFALKYVILKGAHYSSSNISFVFVSAPIALHLF